jgi:hypothetical protein
MCVAVFQLYNKGKLYLFGKVAHKRLPNIRMSLFMTDL